MTILQLQYFLCLCESGSTSKAAKLLHVSQSTLSLSLKNLEQEISLTLFSRDSKGLTLTEEGKVLRVHAEKILYEFQQTQAAIAELSKQCGERLRVGIPTMLSISLVPALLPQLQKAVPRLHIEISSCSGSEDYIFSLLEEGKLDMIIMTLLHPEKIDPSYRIIQIGAAPELAFCISSKNSLAAEEYPSYEKLFSLPLVHIRGAGTSHIENLYREFGCTPNFLYQCEQFSSVTDFIRKDIAVGFLTMNIAANISGIRTIPIPEIDHVNYYLVYKPSVNLSPGKKEFLHFMKNFNLDML